jgi:hypothetical protein
MPQIALQRPGKVGVDGAIFISAFSMYRYDASYAVEVQRAQTTPAQGENRCGLRKYERYMAQDRSLSAAWHRRKDQYQSDTVRHARNRNGRRRRC